MNRALPGWAIDLIRQGVPGDQMRARGDRAVFKALTRTAASAVQRGWGVIEWEHQVLEPQNRLGLQVRLDRKQRERTRARVAETMASAWDAAVVWVSEQPPAWSGEQAAQEAQERAAAAMAAVEDADADLTDAERGVLAFAAQEHVRRGYLQVALPRAAVVTATGLGERSVRTALTSLHRRGVLTMTVPGRSGATEARRRAALYALADAAALPQYLCRETRPMGPQPQTYGTPDLETFGTPSQTYGTPQHDDAPTTTPTGAPTMADQITLTLSPDERAAVLHTLAAMRATGEAPAPLADNVVQFPGSAVAR